MQHARYRALDSIGRFTPIGPNPQLAFQQWMFLRLRSVIEGIRRHDEVARRHLRLMQEECKAAGYPEMPSPDAAEVVIGEIHRQEVHRALCAIVWACRMPDLHRECVLAMLEDEPASVTGKRLGISVGSVTSYRRLGVARVRCKIANIGRRA